MKHKWFYWKKLKHRCCKNCGLIENDKNTDSVLCPGKVSIRVRLEPEFEEDDWTDCWQCGGEAMFHDCGEDCCPCLHPKLNTPCSECKGEGGWHEPFTA